MNGAVLDAATKRTILICVIVTVATFFTTIAQTHDWWLIASIVGTTFCSTIVARFGIEGVYDSIRATNGTVSKGDVPEASKKLEVIQKP